MWNVQPPRWVLLTYMTYFWCLLLCVGHTRPLFLICILFQVSFLRLVSYHDDQQKLQSTYRKQNSQQRFYCHDFIHRNICVIVVPPLIVHFILCLSKYGNNFDEITGFIMYMLVKKVSVSQIKRINRQFIENAVSNENLYLWMKISIYFSIRTDDATTSSFWSTFESRMKIEYPKIKGNKQKGIDRGMFTWVI